MRYYSAKHHRRSVRLEGHDYASAGFYAITICSARRGDIFGSVLDTETVIYNRFGDAVVKEWLKSFEIRSELKLDDWQLMPDYLHAIVEITAQSESVNKRNLSIAPRIPRSLATLVGGFKGAVKLQISRMREQDTKVWQSSFWDHVIRNERDLQNQRQYIRDNPARWLQKARDNSP